MLRSRQLFSSVVVVAMVLGGAVQASAGELEQISLVGSSTVYPFATAVAERFAKSTKFRKPAIESTGTGAGFKRFCAGVGARFPDINNASRAINSSELETCKKNGVTDIVELKIGFDGITLATSKWAPPPRVALKELFLALAKDVPDPSGAERLVTNPHTTWRNINPKFPGTRIQVIGPPTSSGTRDAFNERVMEAGCRQFNWLAAMEKTLSGEFKRICHAVREDGAYVEAGENDDLIVHKLIANPKVMGLFGFSFLDQNTDRLQGAAIDGVLPEYETIANGSYPVSRPLFIYVKKAHVGVTPGLREFLAEFTSEKAWGRNGYLFDLGLIPMPDAERVKYANATKNLESMQ